MESNSFEFEAVLQCTCANKEHAIVIGQYDLGTEFGDDKLDECVINTTLNHYLPFYKRLLVGIKYIFGMDNTFQSHEVSIIRVSELKEVVAKLKTHA